MIRKFIMDLFPPQEVKDVEKQIDILFSRQDWLPHLHYPNVFPQVRLAARAFAKESLTTVRALSEFDLSSEHYALKLIVEVIKAKLASGHYQLYGDVLTEEGEELYRLLVLASDHMILKGYAKSSYRQQVVNDVREVMLRDGFAQTLKVS